MQCSLQLDVNDWQESNSSLLRQASQLCHGGSFEDSSAEHAVSKVGASQALFVEKQWCDRIFSEDTPKIWELRSRATSKRGRVAIAMCKANVLIGEVSIIDSFCVGIRAETGEWIPAGDDPVSQQNFFLSSGNIPKHQLHDTEFVKQYKTIHAWVLSDALKFPHPIPWTPKRGCVQFTDLDGALPSNYVP